MTKKNRIQTVVIVGGGTAGWMAAAGLQRHFAGTPLKITLVESPDIGTIGVGESTTPTVRRFYQRLGLSDLEVMRAIGATCKLGIQFNHWKAPGHSFFHPFSVFGQALKQVDFLHYWLKARNTGLDARLTDFSLGASLALAGKFSPPAPNPPSTLSVYDWALHLDAGRFATLLRERAVAGGVVHIRGKITEVIQFENGFVRSLLLEDGRVLEGDLFVDCSGFQGILIEGVLHTGLEDWSHWLLCDSAWVAPSKREEAPAPYTRVDAHSAGWQWHIPLQQRSGNGRVFASRYIDTEKVREEFVGSLGENALEEPRLLRFRPGIRRRAWNKNVVALGLSAGFIEPLESTSIALIETGIERLKTLFPQRECNRAIADEFNQQTRLEYERVRDFVLLHYVLNGRSDSDFWCDYRAMMQSDQLPDSLQRKIRLFIASGYLLRYRWEMFQPASWMAIFAGFDRLPATWNPAADAFDEKKLLQSLREMRSSVRHAVEQAPDHHEFIESYARIGQ